MTALTHDDVELGLFDKANRVLPAGSFGNVPNDIVIREGRGGRVWDESGNEYVDYLLGSGPMLVGHAHPEVTAAAEKQLHLGTGKGTRDEVVPLLQYEPESLASDDPGRLRQTLAELTGK